MGFSLRHSWYRLNQRFVFSKWGAAIFSRIARPIDSRLLRWSHGRWSAATLLIGAPLVTLTTLGAKTGQPRTLPLLAIPDEQSLLLVASNWGKTNHPAWYHNVKAHPQVQISQNGRTDTYWAYELTDADWHAGWKKVVAAFPGYEVYRQRANGRHIPLIRFRPTSRT